MDLYQNCVHLSVLLNQRSLNLLPSFLILNPEEFQKRNTNSNEQRKYKITCNNFNSKDSKQHLAKVNRKNYQETTSQSTQDPASS